VTALERATLDLVMLYAGVRYGFDAADLEQSAALRAALVGFDFACGQESVSWLLRRLRAGAPIESEEVADALAAFGGALRGTDIEPADSQRLTVPAPAPANCEAAP
jgi:hypothetical protein